MKARLDNTLPISGFKTCPMPDAFCASTSPTRTVLLAYLRVILTECTNYWAT